MALARQCALLAAIEACWLYAAAAVLGPATDAGVPPAWPLLAAVIFANLLFNLLPVPDGGSRPLLAGRLGAAALGMLALGLFPLRATYVAFAIYVAWHARNLAEHEVAEERYRAAIFAGVIGVGAALLARALAGLPADLARAQDWAVAGFAVAAPLSLALAQRLQLQAEEDLAPAGGKGWLIAGGAVLAGIAATAALVAVAPGTARLGLALLDLAGAALSTLVYYLLLPIAYLLFGVLYGPLSALLQRIHPAARPAQPQNPGLLDQLRHQQETMNHSLGQWLGAAEWALIALAALVVLLIVSAGIRRRRDPSRRTPDARRSVWRWRFLRDWLAGLLRQAGELAVAPATLLPTASRRPAVPRSAREAYLDVQARAVRLGWPAPPQHTAHEYCVTLGAKLPAAGQSLARLADAYGDEQYGGATPGGALPALLADWRQIVAESEAAAQHGT